MSRRSPAAFAAAILLAIISAVSAQATMAPGPAPYYNPTMGPASPGSGGGGGGGGEMAPSPAVDCMTQLFNLSDCLSYVTTGSNLTKPDKPCCPELAGLVDSNPICLCSLLTLNASDYGFDIDRRRALGLPSACSVATPPVSLCPGIGGSPTGAPSPSQGGGGAAGDAPAGGPMMGPSPSSSENGGTGTGPSGHGSPTASPKLSTHLLFTTTTLLLLFSTSFFHSH